MSNTTNALTYDIYAIFDIINVATVVQVTSPERRNMKSESLEYLLQRKSLHEPRINIGWLVSPIQIARKTEMAELSFTARREIFFRLVEVATRDLDWLVAGGLASI